jgi:GWxTD domain-containing protein
MIRISLELYNLVKENLFYIFLLILLLYFHLVCAFYKIQQAPLDQNSQKFLDLVRYIITPQEEKIFKEMPPEDRHEFVRDFWKRRDPSPETDANEFRTQYYSRLAVADKAFRTGIPGWMTDRGRIFILLGPPMDVINKSMGESTREFSQERRELSSDLLEKGTRTERPTEIWIYNQYPDYFSGPLRLVFVDYESDGDYKLTTDVEVKSFSMMSYISSDPDMIKYQWVGEITKDESLPDILPFLDYRKSFGKIKKDKAGNHTVECFFEIPFRAIGYRKENNHYLYDLELGIQAENMELESTYREKREIKEELSSEQIRNKINEGHSITGSILIPLEKGTNKVYFSVRDKVRSKRLRKLDIIKIK